MKKQEILPFGLELVNRSEIALLGTINEDGFPASRAMLKMENQELKKIWMSTNNSSGKIEQLRKNPNASLYFVEEPKYIGLLLLGTVEILLDSQSRQRFWRDGFEMYYPKGINDPDYAVLCFTAQKGILYYDLSIQTFDL
jgi:general stress protein 26